MSKRLLALSSAALIAASVAAVSNVASATPVADALAIKNAAANDVLSVQWIGPVGWSWGWSAPGYYYAPVPTYVAPVPAYVAPAPVSADAIAYCARRYRTYDPDTGTYVGRHGAVLSCP
jgi:BA14K-like protein